eukprot:CAMPEP_0116553038 /NCGR_PEP_ID=MMETSP0397-20121206/6826_1 /TAXON_ID=216820 /ORGANISM="Cyclophora tenuis, Strain ECT3854" /LENGTH=100 /DNA_ID=CAMNT_0004078067 /DNA_START=111 /DNA_END=410 /DNA_ORIENTATION=+
MVSWAENGVVHCLPGSLVLQAERVVSNDWKRQNLKQALGLYEKAIVTAGEMGVRRWEGEFNEMAFETISKQYKNEFEVYEKWQAYAKVGRLRSLLSKAPN